MNCDSTLQNPSKNINLGKVANIISGPSSQQRVIPETDILYQTTSLCSTSTMTTTNGKAWELYTVTQVVDFYNNHKNPLRWGFHIYAIE